MTKKWIWGGIIVIGLGGAGTYWYLSQKKSAGKRGGSTSLVQAKMGSIEQTVESTGEVSPLNRVEIKPPIQGRIEKLLVEEGAHVRAGEILAWMSSTDRAAILDAARAQGMQEFKQWEASYKPTPIVAPLSGVIILKNVVVGQTVDATTVLYAMSDRLIVLAQVDEADIGRIGLGMAAHIRLDAYPDQSIEGKVSQVLYEGKNVSNVITYGVKVNPKNPPDFFRSQMTANVNFSLQNKDNVVLIPSAAVHDSRSGEKHVMVPGPDGKPVSRTIETGIESNDQVEVTSGLDAGENVVITKTRYVPQQGPQTSPLAGGGPSNSSGGARRNRQ